MRSVRTIEGVRESGSLLTSAFGEGMRADRLRREHADRLRRHMAEDRGLAVATVAKHLRSLRSMFNRGVDRGDLSENPFARMRLPKTPSRPKRIISADETNALRAVAPNSWWRDFLLVAESTGRRLREILHLRWIDLDLDHGIVRVQPRGEGTFVTESGEVLPVLEWSTKTHETRSVPIPTTAVTALLSRREQERDTPYVFLNAVRLRRIACRRELEPDHQPSLASNYAARFRVMQQSAHQHIAEQRGLRLSAVSWELGTIHDLRRTYATRLAASGTPAHVLKEFMGHAKLSTTMEYYLAVQTDDADRVREVIQQVLGAIHQPGNHITPESGKDQE